jgi:hypothetical protein
MSLFGTLRRAWKRHDDHLAERAYRNEGAEARLESFNDGLETAEITQKVYGLHGAGGPAVLPADDPPSGDLP